MLFASSDSGKPAPENFFSSTLPPNVFRGPLSAPAFTARGPLCYASSDACPIPLHP